MSAMSEIKAYRRPDGRVGIRNYVLVISMVSCSNTVTERIARTTGTIPVVHEQGCCEFEHDHARTKLALIAAGRNPNVGAVLLVGLVVGVVIGLMQALTQIQEATLVYAPKIVAIFLSLLLFLPMMGALMSGFMRQIAARIAAM